GVPEAGRRGGAGPVREVVDPRAFDERIAAWRLAWGGLLVVQVRGAVGGSSEAAGSADRPLPGREVIETLLRRSEYAHLPLVIAVSEDVDLADDAVLLWGIFTRFDCARDLIPAASTTRGAWLACRGPLGVDATWKPGYPDPVASPLQVIERVSGWWRS